MAKKPKRRCTTHDEPLIGKSTRFGMRYDCPVDDCTVMCWGNSTSTPADQETRDARIQAHAAFDALWGRNTDNVDRRLRGQLYGELKKFMGLSGDECHIGMFSKQQCETVIEWSRSVRTKERSL